MVLVGFVKENESDLRRFVTFYDDLSRVAPSQFCAVDQKCDDEAGVLALRFR